MNVAIIGAGPSGLAAARAALQRQANVFMLDRFAEAGGLLRYGVGFWNNPLKELEQKLLTDIDRLARHDIHGPQTIKFRPHSDIGPAELSAISSGVDGIVLACGGKHTKIPPIFAGREATVGCQDFVGYYNHAPWVADAEVSRIRDRLERDGDVVIVGFGNVALDVITFLKLHSMMHFKTNSMLRIHLIGRGPLRKAKWTRSVLREALDSVHVTYHGEDRSSFAALPCGATNSSNRRLVSLHVYDEASVDYTAGSENVRIKQDRLDRETLCKPKLLIPCFGFAEPADFLSPQTDVAAAAGMELCPVVRVGWCATDCRGDVGSAIVSGKLGVHQLFSTMTSKRKPFGVPFGSDDEWVPWSLAKKPVKHAK